MAPVHLPSSMSSDEQDEARAPERHAQAVEASVPKRQRRPSVRLGEIGDQPAAIIAAEAYLRRLNLWKQQQQQQQQQQNQQQNQDNTSSSSPFKHHHHRSLNPRLSSSSNGGGRSLDHIYSSGVDELLPTISRPSPPPPPPRSSLSARSAFMSKRVRNSKQQLRRKQKGVGAVAISSSGSRRNASRNLPPPFITQDNERVPPTMDDDTSPYLETSADLKHRSNLEGICVSNLQSDHMYEYPQIDLHVPDKQKVDDDREGSANNRRHNSVAEGETRLLGSSSKTMGFIDRSDDNNKTRSADDLVVDGTAEDREPLSNNTDEHPPEMVQPKLRRNSTFANGIRGWLRGLALEKYYPIFDAHEVDTDVLPLLTLGDLKEMGIDAVGPRRKMFFAIQQLAKSLLISGESY